MIQFPQRIDAEEFNISGVYRIHETYFYVRGEHGIFEQTETIYLNSIGWLKDLIDQDAVMRGAEIQIRKLNSPLPSWLSYPGPGKSFKYTSDIPPDAIVDGLDTWATPPGHYRRFLLTPETGPVNYAVRCNTSPRLDTPSGCDVLSDYPHDAGLYLLARFYFPTSIRSVAERLDEIRERMQEIARCLDVTDTIALEGHLDQAEVDLRGGWTDFHSCRAADPT
ncbi:hypothetical protein [Pseudoruegeria sp. HB172150]|uniref:hypothetical protein n=1 Tax=Pseudoruegeria sp. HB172150 TaxID=2721164 RepID=UPI001C12D66C|nr:hypothetical protein [Pseudoruegeria sp. HB172150]